MNIDIDIDDVIEEHIKEQENKGRMVREHPVTIRQRMGRILDIAWDYNEAARILLDLLACFDDEHPGYIKEERDRIAQREQEEADMPGGFF